MVESMTLRYRYQVRILQEPDPSAGQEAGVGVHLRLHCASSRRGAHPCHRHSIDDEWERMKTFRLIMDLTEDRFKGVEYTYLCDLIEGHTQEKISKDVRERFYDEL